MVWFEDKQITAEIGLMRGISPAQWNTPLPITMEKNTPLTRPMTDAAGDVFRAASFVYRQGENVMMSISDILQLIVLCALLFFRWDIWRAIISAEFAPPYA